MHDIADLLDLCQVDPATGEADELPYLERNNLVPGLKNTIRYLARLCNEEVRRLARAETAGLAKLAGRTVHAAAKGRGTPMAGASLCDAEDGPIQPVHHSAFAALAALQAGSIAAAVSVARKPAAFCRQVPAGTGRRFSPRELSNGLEAIYLEGGLAAAPAGFSRANGGGERSWRSTLGIVARAGTAGSPASPATSSLPCRSSRPRPVSRNGS